MYTLDACFILCCNKATNLIHLFHNLADSVMNSKNYEFYNWNSSKKTSYENVLFNNMF